MMVGGFAAGAIFICMSDRWAEIVVEKRRIRTTVKLVFISMSLNVSPGASPDFAIYAF